MVALQAHHVRPGSQAGQDTRAVFAAIDIVADTDDLIPVLRHVQQPVQQVGAAMQVADHKQRAVRGRGRELGAASEEAGKETVCHVEYIPGEICTCAALRGDVNASSGAL